VQTVVSVALAPLHAEAVVCVERHVTQVEHEVALPAAYVLPEHATQALRPFVAA